MDNTVLLSSLAEELDLDKSSLRKFVKAQGIEFARIRTPESRGQLTLALTPEDAENIRELRQSYVAGTFAGDLQTGNGSGHFYIIQVIPDLLKGRVKFGFTSNIDARLASHRTSAPTAELLKIYPARRSWEDAAIASITRVDCTLVANEVYDCEDTDTLIERADTFFALLPSP